MKVSDDYLRWPKFRSFLGLGEINGMAENRGGALINIEREPLEKRMRDYFNPDIEWAEYQATGGGLAKDAARFDAQATRQKAVKVGFNPENIARYGIRPFDFGHCYYTEIRPIWNEPRPTLWSHFKPGNCFLLSRNRSVAANEGIPMFFTSAICDYHFFRGDAKLFPMRLWSGEMGEQKSSPNLSELGASYLSGLGYSDLDSGLEDLFYHSLATGYSGEYRLENADGLRIDWPRIPLPESRSVLESSAALGRRVAEFLDSDTRLAGVDSGAVLPAYAGLGILRPGPSGVDLRVEASWGHLHGQGKVFPGSGLLGKVREWTAEESRGWGAAEREALGGALDVYLNGELGDGTHWSGVPEAAWNFHIGGYQAAKKWLSYRHVSVLGRSLRDEEALHFTGMIRRLSGLVLLGKKLDENYRAARDSAAKRGSDRMGGVMQWLREKILPIGKWRVFAIILAGLVTFSADDFAYLFLPEEWITHNTQILGWVQLIAYLVVRAMAVWLFVSFVWWVCKNAEQWAKKIRRRKRGSNRMGRVMQLLHGIILSIGKWRVFAIILAGLVTFSADNFARRFLPKEWITHNMQILGWVQFIAYLVVCAVAVWLLVSFVWWVCKNAKRWTKRVMKWLHKKNLLNLRSWGNAFALAIILVILVALGAANFAHLFVPDKLIIHKMWVLEELQFLAYLAGVGFALWKWRRIKAWSDVIFGKVISGTKWSNSEMILAGLAVMGVIGFTPLLLPNEWIDPDASVVERLQFAAYLIGGGFLVWQLRISNRRASAAEKNAQLVEKGNITERFKNAIEFLADKSESVQIGGIYTLYHVAKEAEEYKEAVLKILLAHLRKITAREENPINRVVMAIWDALFVPRGKKTAV